MASKATVIAVVNQKGGTAKTTTCENLGVGLAMEGKKVLCIDMDPQASLTIALGWQRPDDLNTTVATIMSKIMNDQELQPREGILHHQEGVDLLPSSIELSGLEVSLVNAMSREKGKHAFIVATHTDKAHIHNHIIFNSTTLDCDKKFRDFYFSGIALQRLSDIICIEHGLSIIDAKTYPKRGKNPKFKKRDSYRDFICADIDDILKKKPKDFEDFLKMMQDAGYECKRGKHVAFRSKSQKRFVRMRSLGENYSEEAIMAVLSGNRDHQTKFNEKHPRPQRPLKLLVDVQAKLNEKGPGYARWATSYNLKEMAKTMLFIRENKIDTLEELQDLARGKASDYDELDAKLKAIESRLSDVAVLKKHIINYRKTKDTYVAYRKAGYSKKFLEEHRQEITLHKAAKEYFDQLPGDKLPTIKALNEEYASLLAEKKKISSNYYPARSEMKEYVTAERNVRTFLEIGEEVERKQKEIQRKTVHPEH